MSKTQKHYEIKTIGESKLNSVKNLISKALNDGQISTEEFQLLLCELDRYNDLKAKTHTKQEKKEVNRRRKITGTGDSQKKDKRHIILFNKFVFVNDPPPKYQNTKN